MAHSSLSSGWTVGETIIEASWLVCMRLTSNDRFFLHFNNILNESCLLWRPRLDVLSPSMNYLSSSSRMNIGFYMEASICSLLMIAQCRLPSIISTSTSPTNAPTCLFSYRSKKKVSRNLSCYYSCWSIFYFCFHIYSPSSEPGLEQYIAAVALQSQERVMKIRYNF